MAIDHKTITDSEKHTPKGYPDTGSPGTNHVYQYNGSALAFGLVDTGNIAPSAVTNDKVANGTLGAEKFQTIDAGAVGSYAMLRDISDTETQRDPGYETSGSNLAWASTGSFASFDFDSPPGTWRLMGILRGDLSLTNAFVTSLWLRVS